MNIGEEISTRTIQPARITQPSRAPSVPKRDFDPATPPSPVENPDKQPVKTPAENE